MVMSKKRTIWQLIKRRVITSNTDLVDIQTIKHAYKCKQCSIPCHLTVLGTSILPLTCVFGYTQVWWEHIEDRSC